ncbi:MAG: hypothetical protein KAT94_00160 [Candidatus Aenigmarchaeota archaeon]|nr:hypothetical protein [Candidatus Aenigmarchaeota archaeon]MCK4531260.1 hypothetical protein [Candidatus Aenigmarchaeota archaeon]
MKLKIGVFGSSGNVTEESRKKAFELGKEIAKHDCILVTGATTGLPYEAVKGAKEGGGFVVGISPAHNLEEHVNKYGMPKESHDVVIFTGFGRKGRNLINVRSCDASIFVSGSYGTLNEFTTAYDEGKVMGIMEGTGGVSDHLKEIVKICNKETGAKIFYDSDPRKLVEKLLEVLG